MKDRIAAFLVRRRVTMGFLAACGALLLAQPTWLSWTVGLIIASVGEGLRVWAAGHLEKGREVTRSGPYRWTRHPLYVGSTVIAVGVIVAARSVGAAIVGAAYIAVTLPMAIRAEEAFLRRTFGTTYDQYQRAEAPPMLRRFSLSRTIRNREDRAIAGLIGGFAVLAGKILLL